MKRKNAQLNISFAWIFAIVVGAFILFLAIYGVTKFVNIQKTQQGAETGKEISVLLNPLESSFETTEMVTIYAPTETRIFFECENPKSSEVFGKQKIWTLQKVYNSWTPTKVEISSRNRYVFSENPVEGKSFVAFSKPFEFPPERRTDSSFKVADLIYIFPSDEKYCFTDADEEIIEELDLLQNNSRIKNFYFDDCPTGSKKICFDSDSEDCYAKINYNSGIVEKNSEGVYFETDALMYAAIFSENSEYECQIGRIMARAKQLAEIYEIKSEMEKNQSCPGVLDADLIIFKTLLNSYNNSEDLSYIANQAEQLNARNSMQGDCKLW